LANNEEFDDTQHGRTWTMNDLKDKVAIVTGGAGGIGFSVCEALGGAGCRVFIADISEPHGRAAEQKLRQAGGVCEYVRVDVAREDSVRAMVEGVEKRHGRIDILVSSSGVPAKVTPTIQLSSEEWTRVLTINLFGVFLCCREVGSVMVRQVGGRIINMASLNAVSPPALTAAYNVSKAGVVSLTQTLAVELAPFGINVNAISPGPIETEFNEIIMPQRAATLGITRDQMVEKIRASIPLGRWGATADVANAVLFLASRQSDWITGQNLIVSGGLTGVAASPPKEVILRK
jgi:NAD(P)-dependent dehydrogenase (short-subunit alcohol dehydrogenase family)